MLKKAIIAFLLLHIFCVDAQIINVENLRRVTDTVGWSGNIRLNLHLIRNTNTIFGIGNRIHVQYKTPKHLWLFVNNLDFRELNSEKYVSRNSQHLRHNYRFNSKIALETFLQSQEDEIADIRFRGLIGTGLRFKLSKKEQYKLYFGSLIMFENEKVIEDEDLEITRNDWRSSSYFSMNLRPKKHISVVSTTYFQPRLDKFSDFRIASETTVAFKIVKSLSFTATFMYEYDEFPVSNVPREQYRLTNGLSYSF